MKLINTIDSLLRCFKGLKNGEITFDLIARECPGCKKISEKLNINIEDLLATENYRHIIHFLKNEERFSKFLIKLENFDYNNNFRMFLLKQAANRIEMGTTIVYDNLRTNFGYSFYKKLVMEEFEKLKMYDFS